MMTILAFLLTLIVGAMIVGGTAVMVLIVFGLGSVALFLIKVVMALGLVYCGIKMILNILNI